MSDIVSFTVAYDGSALDKHSMDVRDLGPALMSLGQLFDESNRVLNGDKANIKLQVKAHEKGSFEIVFEISQTLSSQVTGFLTGDFVTSAVNLAGLVAIGTAGVKSLFWLIIKLKGGKPKKIEDLKNGNIRIEIDGEVFEAPLALLRLYQDLGVRTAAEKVLKPLENTGIDTFLIKNSKGQIIEKIDKSSIEYFKIPDIEDEKIIQMVNQSAYSIVSLAFKEDNKWRLFDGNSTISATIKDEDFLRKVDGNLISFAKGDILICKVQTTQWKTSSGLKTEYEVQKIISHKVAARQINLFDEPLN